MKREFYERILLCTTFVPPLAMLIIVYVFLNKRRKTSFMVSAMNGIIEKKTINSKTVLIFGGRQLPELNYNIVWPDKLRNARGDRISICDYLFYFILQGFYRPCFCCIRKPYFSLGNSLLIFSILFRSVLLQIFMVVASLEVTYKCRYDLFLDCFRTFIHNSGKDSLPINCTLIDPSKDQDSYTCYRLVFYYPSHWLLACVYTFLFAKLMHLIVRFMARFMLHITNKSCVHPCANSTQRNNNSAQCFYGKFLSPCCVRVISCTLALISSSYAFIMTVLLSKMYRISYVTTWRIVAGSVVMIIFLCIIPWADIGNNKVETINRASKELQEPRQQDAISRV